jgi:tetratricopeptide (TPR) repeat protein
MQRLQFTFFAAVIVAFASLASSVSAQTGRATGIIKDADGKAIKGAIVRASNDVVASKVTSATDDKGRFAMIGLRTGTWRLEVEAPGYLPMQGQAAVSSGNTPYLQLVMTRDPGPMPGALSKSITDDIASAETLRKAGRYDDAIGAYQSIQSKNARLTSVNLMLATLYREKAQQEKDAPARQALLGRAIAAYGEMLKNDDTNTRARIELGVTQVAAGNTDAAAKAFQDVIAANPKSPAATEAAAHLQEIRK